MAALKKLSKPIPPKDIPITEIRTPAIMFDRNEHFTIGDDNPQREYRMQKDLTPDEKFKGITTKWGQLKLLLSELQFFTLYWNPIDVPNPIVVYVGAAIGTHIIGLVEMFPTFTWHLYDKNVSTDPRGKQLYDFNPILREEKYKDKIIIFDRYFGSDDVIEYQKMNNRIFFLSDIRNIKHDTSLSTEESAKKMENLVWADMEMQQRWVSDLNPVKALLKFRLPYSNPYTLSLGKTRKYLSGVVYLQQYTSATSTELRLVPYDNITQQNWDFTKVESIIFYHNSRIREDTRFLNPITSQDKPLSLELGISQNYDSTAMIVIGMEYLKKFGVSVVTEEMMIEFINYLTFKANNGKSTLLGKFNRISGQVEEDED